MERNKPRQESNPAIVLGLSPNGLGIVRSLDAAGVPVIGIDRRPQGPWDTNIWMSSRTRLCQKVFYTKDNNETLLSCLLSVAQSLDQPGVLIPSSDNDLLCISRNREALSKHFLFRVPDSNVVELLADKARFYRFSLDNDIPTPLTYVDPTPDQIQNIAEEIHYPCLIKPHIRDSAWNQAFSNQKVLVAADPASLIYLFTSAYHVNRSTLVQEIIPGPDCNLYFSHVYLAEDLAPLAIWTGRKIRQWPIHFGTSTMTETVWDQAVADISLKILRELHCVGYSSIEFKKDPRDGRYKIMEVTQGRTWYPHYLGYGAGINIPLAWYRDLLGEEQPPCGKAKDGVRWIDECHDPAAAFNYWRNGELGFLDWIRSYKGVAVYAFASFRDPLPLLYVFFRLAIEPFRVLGRMARRVLSVS